MTFAFTTNNVNSAFVEGFWHLKTAGKHEDTRNGEALVAPGPVVTEYLFPQQRVMFNPIRDANPVFHLMESIWMLAGGKNVEWLLPFNSQFGRYAEDNGDVHGAYGFRWRSHFGFDQIQSAVELLSTNPDTRQVVITMWDPDSDLGVKKRDIPCNTQIYVDRRGDRLNMTVMARSNDALWGVYGANVVHMSVLQEVLAAGVNVPIGAYRQFSNNFHAYVEAPNVGRFLDNPSLGNDNRYEDRGVWGSTAVTIMPLVGEGEAYGMFLSDCESFVMDHTGPFNTRFMNEIAAPLRQMYHQRKTADITSNLENFEHQSNDWFVAF